jgi:hypothetical protein
LRSIEYRNVMPREPEQLKEPGGATYVRRFVQARRRAERPVASRVLGRCGGLMAMTCRLNGFSATQLKPSRLAEKIYVGGTRHSRESWLGFLSLTAKIVEDADEDRA